MDAVMDDVGVTEGEAVRDDDNDGEAVDDDDNDGEADDDDEAVEVDKLLDVLVLVGGATHCPEELMRYPGAQTVHRVALKQL